MRFPNSPEGYKLCEAMPAEDSSDEDNYSDESKNDDKSQED